MAKLLTREKFNKVVKSRDGNTCLFCDSTDVIVHHIIDRSLFEDGGYYKDNGATLCDHHHIMAEEGKLECDEIRHQAGIENIVLPECLVPVRKYNKWGEPVDDLIKYPSTTHIEGSALQKNDSEEVILFSELKDKNLVVEAKIDGANTGISFSYGGELLLQCRGHYLRGKGDWDIFDEFKVWANTFNEQLIDILEDRYIMYGEWMAALHTIYYDRLPHFFMEFDIYDKHRNVFLSTGERRKITDKAEIPIHSVVVLKEQSFEKLEDMTSLIGRSPFISGQAYDRLEKEMRDKRYSHEERARLAEINRQALMEGLYVKWEENGVVKGRYKYVRSEFTQTIIDGDSHWASRPTIWNKLKPGTSIYEMR